MYNYKKLLELHSCSTAVQGIYIIDRGVCFAFFPQITYLPTQASIPILDGQKYFFLIFMQHPGINFLETQCLFLS